MSLASLTAFCASSVNSWGVAVGVAVGVCEVVCERLFVEVSECVVDRGLLWEDVLLLIVELLDGDVECTLVRDDVFLLVLELLDVFSGDDSFVLDDEAGLDDFEVE